MALPDKMRGIPRDPEAMDDRRGSSLLTIIFALVGVLVVAGLVFAYTVGQGPAQRIINPSSTRGEPQHISTRYSANSTP